MLRSPTDSLMPPLLSLLLLAAAGGAWAQGVVYRCPGNLYTSELSPRQAQERGCKTIEGMPITIVHPSPPPAPRARPVAPPAAPGANAVLAPAGARASGERVDTAAQRQRDADSRRILEEELRREEERLAALKMDWRNGEPERRGDERNYQKYLDRVSETRAAIARSEADIAAIRRELAKLGSS